MAGPNLSSFDFDDLKSSFRAYLSQQTEFSDYNFDGSGLTQLLNILISSNQANAFIANMLANEMWLQTSTKRGSAASSSALINYVPRSAHAAVATVTMVSVKNDLSVATPEYITIPRGTKFAANSDGVTIPFVCMENYISYRIDLTNTYATQEMDIYQGKLMTFNYPVTTDELVPYEIPSEKVDLSTLKVIVQTSNDNTNTVEYTLAKSIVSLTDQSNVYFLEEGYKGRYQIRFGNGIFGSSLKVGNIVRLEYLVTDGPTGNYIRSFIVSSEIPVVRQSIVTTILPAGGGADRESVSSIKTIAPRHYVAQDRCVAPNDFSTLIKTAFPIIRDAATWGGQEMDPPLYGNSIVSIRLNDGYQVTTRLKSDIVAFLKSKGVVTVTPRVVTPEELYIRHNVRLVFKASQITNPENVRDSIVSGISTWAEDHVGTFNASYYHSNLEAAIDESSTAILSNETTIELEKRLNPLRSGPRNYVIEYGNSLRSGTLTSDIFTYKGQSCSFRDSNGVIDIISTDPNQIVTVVESSIGSINYEKGSVNLYQFYPELTSSSYISIIATPVYRDVTVKHNNIIIINLDKIRVNLVPV